MYVRFVCVFVCGCVYVSQVFEFSVSNTFLSYPKYYGILLVKIEGTKAYGWHQRTFSASLLPSWLLASPKAPLPNGDVLKLIFHSTAFPFAWICPPLLSLLGTPT